MSTEGRLYGDVFGSAAIKEDEIVFAVDKTAKWGVMEVAVAKEEVENEDEDDEQKTSTEMKSKFFNRNNKVSTLDQSGLELQAPSTVQLLVLKLQQQQRR
jgi:hypothetical protein